MKSIFVFLSVFVLGSSLWAAPKEQTSQFKGVKIVVTEDPDTLSPTAKPPMKIPSWSLKTFKGKKQIDSLEFKNVEANGGRAGIFAFEKQPFEDYFSFKKDGDYDSQCLMISKSGKIIAFPCLEVFKDSKKYYFIRNSEGSEEVGGGVIDRASGKSEAFMQTYPPYSKSLKIWDHNANKWNSAKASAEYFKELNEMVDGE